MNYILVGAFGAMVILSGAVLYLYNKLKEQEAQEEYNEVMEDIANQQEEVMKDEEELKRLKEQLGDKLDMYYGSVGPYKSRGE